MDDPQPGFAVLDHIGLIGIRGFIADYRLARDKHGIDAAREATRAVENIPGRSALSGLAKRASKTKMREFGSTAG